MGAITRSAANNITTSGVILPAGINDASVASITALAQVSAGDGITLISSQTASSSASLSFTGIDSTYRTYMFKFINIHQATDDVRFSVNFSSDGGSSYNVTKTSSSFNSYHYENDSDAILAYEADQDLAQGTGYQDLSRRSGNANDESISGQLILFSPSNTTFVKHYIAETHSVHTLDIAYRLFVAGYANTTSAINAIDFKMSSGNIDAGTIHMYGIA
jgi:hypothetical protein